MGWHTGHNDFSITCVATLLRDKFNDFVAPITAPLKQGRRRRKRKRQRKTSIRMTAMKLQLFQHILLCETPANWPGIKLA